MTSLTPERIRARKYFAERAIGPRVAHELGVKLDGNELVYPTGKRRPLSGDGPRFTQPAGKPLGLWWLQRPTAWTSCLLCEGESDALAAVTALRSSPQKAHLADLPVAAVPGTAFPAERIVAELRNMTTAFLAFDSDDAGQRATVKAEEALFPAGIRPVVVPVPPDHDLASWLVDLPEEERGEVFANVLHDAEITAPTMADLRREAKIAQLEQEIEVLRMAA